MNATYLFEGKNGFRHSESRWSSIAQIAFIWMSEQNISLNIYTSNYESKLSKDWLVRQDRKMSFLDWNNTNSTVEGKLGNNVFGLKKEKWHKDFDNLSPDIVYIEKNKIVIVEVKTVRASVQGNIKRYRELVKCLNEKGYEVDFYYLLSYGHNPNADWRFLKEDNANILLWEELFQNISESEVARFAGGNLENYCLMPDWLQKVD